MGWLRSRRRAPDAAAPLDQARARMVREQIASRGLTDPELLPTLDLAVLSVLLRELRTLA